MTARRLLSPRGWFPVQDWQKTLSGLDCGLDGLALNGFHPGVGFHSTARARLARCLVLVAHLLRDTTLNSFKQKIPLNLPVNFRAIRI